ncbi:MAG: hypothetical protein WCR19_04685 [Acholeplasmataceae bacterium]
MFTGINFIDILIIVISVFVLLLGIFFVYAGVSILIKINKKKQTQKPVEIKAEPVKVDTVIKPKVDYLKLTLVELKVVAKEKGLIEKLNVKK